MPPGLCAHTATLPRPTGWRLEVLEAPQDVTVHAGGQASFSCTLSETVPVGEVTWYINGASVQPDDTDWTVTADGSHHALLLRRAQPHHAGEVTFAARDAVVSARLTVLGGWLGPACRSLGPGLWGRWVGGRGVSASEAAGGCPCSPTWSGLGAPSLPVTPAHLGQPRRKTGLRGTAAHRTREQTAAWAGLRVPAARCCPDRLLPAPQASPTPQRTQRWWGAAAAP